MTRLLIAIACLLSCLSLASANQASNQIIEKFDNSLAGAVFNVITTGQTINPEGGNAALDNMWVGRAHDNACTIITLGDTGPYVSYSATCHDYERYPVVKNTFRVKAVTAARPITSTVRAAGYTGEDTCLVQKTTHLPKHVLGVKLHCFTATETADFTVSFDAAEILISDQPEKPLDETQVVVLTEPAN